MKAPALVENTARLLRLARVHLLACARELAWTRSRLHLPRNEAFTLRTSRDDGIGVRFVDPEETVDRPPPHMPGEPSLHAAFAKEQHVTLPATYVAELREARFWGHYGGSVFTSDGRLILDLSKDLHGPELHSAYVRLRLPRPVSLPGRTLSLVTPEADNNYHRWMIDLLPRIGLAERAGYDLRTFDRILIKTRDLPYQRETLSRLRIDPAQLMTVDHRTHIVADHLVVPSVPQDNSRVNRQSLLYARELYLPRETPSAAPKRRLYLSRGDAGFRHLANEEHILPLLQRHGFEVVTMSALSVAEQAKLFSEAAVVLGPNGAAFANLVFASPSCRVIELFAPDWVVRDSWMMCTAMGLHYTALIGQGSRPDPDQRPRGLKDDLTIDPALLERVLAELPK